MHTLSRLGGWAALIQGALLLLIPLFLTVLLPAQGIAGLPALADPDVALPAVGQSIVLRLFTLVQVPVSLCLALVTLALDERLRPAAPALTRLATAAGLMASTLFLVVGVTRFAAVGYLGGQYAQDPAGSALAYRTIGLMVDGIYTAGVFAAGWWTLLASWAGRRTGQLPRWLNLIGLVLGLSGIISLVVPIQPVLGVIWFFWLGAILLRHKPPQA